MRLFSIFTSGTLVAVILLLSLGCAEERDPVDRVQPYALDKTFFVGEDLSDASDDPEFYSRNHIIDVGYGANGASESIFTSSWAEPVGRIKWQITEDYLIARAAYERIEGSDGKGVSDVNEHGQIIGNATNDGIIVAMFAIASHFDIVNDYNATTGEKLNVIEENDEDRPWYERKYMRVDWSTNLNTDSYDFDTLSLVGVFDGVEYEPISYYVEDPNDDEAPHFELEDGYFDVTTKAFAKPKDVDLSALGWGDETLPACFLSNDILGGTAPVGSCNPVEITLRHSFVRLDRDGDGIEDSDYEPRAYDGIRFENFGGFYHERYGYDRNFGLVDDKMRRMLNRYNLWERSHYYTDPDKMTGEIPCDTNVDADDNGTADACEAVTKESKFAGSQCDIFKKRCTLPFRARTAKPIPFFYTDTSNPEYFEPSELAVHEWDVALRSAIQTARYTECVSTADDKAAAKATCRDKYPMWRGQMDDQQDAVALALEVDDCRSGRAYNKKNKKECKALADTIGDKRCVARDGTRRCVSDAVRYIAKMDEMLVLCHSPVAFDDPPLCGKARMPEGATGALCAEARNLDDKDDLSLDLKQLIAENETISNRNELIDACNGALRVRHGDLRYHVINVIEAPQEPSPWGIMVSSIDPVTGENIATNCNVWSHVTDKATQKYVDQMRFIKGEITADEITDGDYVSGWIAAADAASRGGAFGTVSKAQVSTMVSTYANGSRNPDFLDEIAKGILNSKPITAEEIDLAHQIADSIGNIAADSHTSDPDKAVVEARKSAARGTSLEAALMTKAVLQKAGVGGLPISEAVLNQASPLRGGDPKITIDLKQKMHQMMTQKNACFLDAGDLAETPVSLAPLADIMEQKFGKFNADDALSVQYERAEKIRKYLAYMTHYGVIAHEIGHSIAHRHNFAGSSNPWAYSPQYWQLRTQDGKVKDVCKDVVENGEACVGPRYLDPITDDERNNLIHMFMTSSVMDYPGEITQEFMGPGIWDFAATRMFYGDSVSVIDEKSFYQDANGDYNTTLARGVARSVSRTFGGLRGITFDVEKKRKVESIHYSELEHEYDMINSCAKVDDLDAFIPGRWDAEALGEWNPIVDGRIVAPNGNEYTRCRQHQVDYVKWTDIDKSGSPSTSNPTLNPYDDEGRVMEPYTYASDNWADIGNVSVYRHDNGADLYEIFNFLVTQKELSTIFDKYRRNRADFSIRYVADSMLSRYSNKLKEGAKGLAFYRSLYNEYGLQVGANPTNLFNIEMADDVALQSNIVASTYAFNFFARELARPESGSHNFGIWGTDPILRYNEPGDFSYYGAVPGAAVVIPNGPQNAWGMMSAGGELLENRLDRTKGEFDTEYTLNCGSYYDKLNIGMLLAESEDRFISSSREDFYDARWRSTSLADLFPDGYRRLIGNALTDDAFIKGPRIQTDNNGTPLVRKVNGDPMLGAPIGWTSWWGDEPTHCFPVEGRNVCGSFLDDWADDAPEYTVAIDPQIGWEQQKFLIATSLLYLPENQKQQWINQFMIYDLGKDADPSITNRIELHHPDGRIYVARTFGREALFGRTVQKGIAARVLEYANQLLEQAYENTPVDIDGDDLPDWYEPLFDTNGQPLVKFDPDMVPKYATDAEICNEETNTGCTCDDNRACMALRDYMSVPAFLWETLRTYRMAGASAKGLYD